MIKHIVMWRLMEEVEGTAKEGNTRVMRARLEALPKAIPEIGRLEVGLNIKDSERAADVVLYSEFDSPEALATYIQHPAHQEVVAFIREVASETRVVDYEV
ncbi:MAG: Dabb family protein [Fidelibacterota bacterium]|nr:MAG: Dabb family protein [Candidatus Neomarinimicrobiota bacterium]